MEFEDREKRPMLDIALMDFGSMSLFSSGIQVTVISFIEQVGHSLKTWHYAGKKLFK